MNEDDLVKLASKAADEPIGDAADSAELAELEQAMAVLRGATEEASEPRMNELAERAADQSTRGAAQPDAVLQAAANGGGAGGRRPRGRAPGQLPQPV